MRKSWISWALVGGTFIFGILSFLRHHNAIDLVIGPFVSMGLAYLFNSKIKALKGKVWLLVIQFVVLWDTFYVMSYYFDLWGIGKLSPIPEFVVIVGPSVLMTVYFIYVEHHALAVLARRWKRRL